MYAFTSQETLSKLCIIRGMSKVKVFFLERVFEEGIYYVCVGDVFMVTLNERFNVSVLTLKCFLDYTHMDQKDQDYAEKGNFFFNFVA